MDFDGTIATADVVDLILEKFADPKWKDVEREWADGRIGSRECLARQIALVKATPAELAEAASKVPVDPYFVSFLQIAEQLGVLVTIVSDGFDLLIQEILKTSLDMSSGYLRALPIFSNRLVPEGAGFKAVFPFEGGCEHGCANCKAALIDRLVSSEDHVLFVGDGLSDRYAAHRAHITFAKGKLLSYCREKGLDCIGYDDFKKVGEWLADNYGILRKTVFKS